MRADVVKLAIPLLTATLAAPGKTVPLSLKETTPRLPGEGAMVALKVTSVPPVVAVGAAVSVVAVATFGMATLTRALAARLTLPATSSALPPAALTDIAPFANGVTT